MTIADPAPYDFNVYVTKDGHPMSDVKVEAQLKYALEIPDYDFGEAYTDHTRHAHFTMMRATEHDELLLNVDYAVEGGPYITGNNDRYTIDLPSDSDDG